MVERVRRHVERFNAAQRSGAWAPFVATFAEDAVMRFAGVPVGPFAGPDAIRAAYEAQPPTDTMSVVSVDTDGDTDVVRFAWDAGGTGTLTVRWRGDEVADLTVAFD
jgi:ketosteroid isomerase-like protein